MKSSNCYGPMRAIPAIALAAAVFGMLTSGMSMARAAVPTGTPTFSNSLDFTNTYQPFQPGGMKVYQGASGRDKMVLVNLYLSETRSFAWNGTNVECRILREIDFEDGLLAEISDNYFAQADNGAVYYFGEVVNNYEDSVLTNHNGSWLVGGPTLSDPPGILTAANPTVFMPAHPAVDDVFKPEDLPPDLDETAKVVRVDVTVRVPAGRYENAIKIEETSSLEPGKTTKWYVPGVGVVLEKAKREYVRLISSTLIAPEEPE